MGCESNTYASSEGMSEKTFSRFSSYVQSELGIKMPGAKKTMLQARLSKRLRRLSIGSFDDYYDYLFSPEGVKDELSNFIDVVTTNKTDFFREPKHFDYLVQSALPELIKTTGAGMKRDALLWSAGCSTGEEPYTLAMVLSEFREKYTGFDYSIMATDISNQVLNEAVLGIYDESDIAPISLPVRKKYLLRSRNRERKQVRIVPELRKKIVFRWLNFMDDDYGIRRKRDIIFCRNVIIYFNRQTQEQVLNRFCRYLNSGGYLFMGHSETLNGLNVPLSPVAPTVYRKQS